MSIYVKLLTSDSTAPLVFSDLLYKLSRGTWFRSGFTTTSYSISEVNTSLSIATNVSYGSFGTVNTSFHNHECHFTWATTGNMTIRITNTGTNSITAVGQWILTRI